MTSVEAKKTDAKKDEKPYNVCISSALAANVQAYQADVLAGKAKFGGSLTKELARRKVGGEAACALGVGAFLDALVATKAPKAFAENGRVSADGLYTCSKAFPSCKGEWSCREFSILGDVTFHIPCQLFDDGVHHPRGAIRVHEPPVAGHLLFAPALLLVITNGPDFLSVVKQPAAGAVESPPQLDEEKYYQAYERKLLPPLVQASRVALARGKRAFVSVPGLGCGFFAGSGFGANTTKQIQRALHSTLARLLREHAEQLKGLSVVYFDPYVAIPGIKDAELVQRVKCADGTEIRYVNKPLTRGGVPQLAQLSRFAALDELADLKGELTYAKQEFFSMVAWDHVSWPGNDFWAGSRATDDGVKAAATSCCAVLTGQAGSYDAVYKQYDPPAGFDTWGELADKGKRELRVDDRLVVVDTSKRQEGKEEEASKKKKGAGEKDEEEKKKTDGEPGKPPVDAPTAVPAGGAAAL